MHQAIEHSSNCERFASKRCVRLAIGWLSCISLAALTACGGGGGSGPTASSPPDPTPAPSPTSVTLAGDGNGLWSGDAGGDAGGGDGAGAAGDGEFVKVSITFPNAVTSTGTLTWTVVRSQYGLTGTTGTLSIQKDKSGQGGYKVVAVNGVPSVSSSQANFYVATNGQISGSLPLMINGGRKDTLFTFAQLLKSTGSSTDFSEYAGQYGFGFIAVDTGTGFNPIVSSGVFQLKADGTGRICDQSFVYSDSCTNGLDVVATYEDPAARNLLRFRQAAKQSHAIANGWATGADVLAVMHKFGSSGMSFTGDFVTTGPNANRTGAQFGSRVGSAPLNPTALVGAWNSVIVVPYYGIYTTYFAISNSNGTVRSRYGISPTNCGATTSTLVANPLMNGSLVSYTPGSSDSYVIQLDSDVAAYVVPGEEIGFARRYSTKPTDAPCQPG